jgi:hypothetical protein
MRVQGCDCLIVIKTEYRETGIPYAEETIREAVSLLREEAAIEGDGCCRGIRKSGGVTGCVVTPLTIGTAPLLLYLAMGSAGLPLYVSETRNIYLYKLNLLPAENSTRFDLVQDRGCSRKLYEGCAVTRFELRIHREQAVKLRLDIRGERPTVNKLRISTPGKGVGVAENPRSGVGARGSSVKKGFSLGKRTLFLGTHVLPLLNLLTVGNGPRLYTPIRI